MVGLSFHHQKTCAASEEQFGFLCIPSCGNDPTHAVSGNGTLSDIIFSWVSTVDSMAPRPSRRATEAPAKPPSKKKSDVVKPAAAAKRKAVSESKPDQRIVKRRAAKHVVELEPVSHSSHGKVRNVVVALRTVCIFRIHHALEHWYNAMCADSWATLCSGRW